MFAKSVATISTNRSLRILLFVFAASAVLIHGASSFAQAPDSTGQERTLTMKEGFSVPLELKVRNLQSKTWLKDLEIEVKNVAKKPIYAVVAYLMFPEAKLAGNIGIPLDFGNPKNVSFDRSAEPEDPHIDPGDTYIFKIQLDLQKGFAGWLKEAVDPPEAYNKIVLWVAIISFGDGTGLVNGREDGQRKHAPAQSLATAQSLGTQAAKERVLVDLTPARVPIKIKLKKEKEESFKDFANGKWPGEFELELTNTGDKPIYFLHLEFISDVEVNGSGLIVDALMYGRTELGDIISKSWPEDIPIKPGETYVFTIHPAQVSTWEDSLRKGHHRDAAKIQVLFQTLSFGDGTGFWGAQGTPYPPQPRQ